MRIATEPPPTAPPTKGKCPTGKRRYKKRQQAERALAVISKRQTGLTARNERRTYKCGICGGHHLTSKEPTDG